LIPIKTKILNTHVLRLPKSYPVYGKGYRQHLQVIEKYVDAIPNLLAIGRYGAFKYNNQDHSILMGLMAAREIITGEKQGLWNINSDTDYHEDGEVLKSSS